jgi:glutamate synthase (NADPH/NADH) large chain
VVEGVGDHGCEYMTGGTALILGSVGRNFGAGMSGGIAYIWDIHDTLKTNFNPDMADIESLMESDVQIIKSLLEEHIYYTNSKLGKLILEDFENNLKYIVKVFPRDYKQALIKAGKL